MRWFIAATLTAAALAAASQSSARPGSATPTVLLVLEWSKPAPP